jgi:hypothetical protein
MTGRNAVRPGEWGHNPLPWMDDDELRYRDEVPCYCGKQGLHRNLYLRHRVLPRDYQRLSGSALSRCRR